MKQEEVRGAAGLCLQEKDGGSWAWGGGRGEQNKWAC